MCFAISITPPFISCFNQNIKLCLLGLEGLRVLGASMQVGDIFGTNLK